jgi:hypothetical protein
MVGRTRLLGLAVGRQRAGNGTQQHSPDDVICGMRAKPELMKFGEAASTKSRGALRLQSAGGGVALRIPTVKIDAVRDM